jgi:hypothetical protein
MQVRYVLPVGFLDETVIRNCTSYKMGHHHILRFLFISGLKTFFLIGRLDVEGEKIATATPGSYFISFLTVGPGQSSSQPIKSKNA